jgi:hypothetical protein
LILKGMLASFPQTRRSPKPCHQPLGAQPLFTLRRHFALS